MSFDGREAAITGRNSQAAEDFHDSTKYRSTRLGQYEASESL